MPLGLEYVCSSCSANSSEMWKRTDDGEVLCYNCSNPTTIVGSAEANRNDAENLKEPQEDRTGSGGCVGDVKEKNGNQKPPIVSLRKSARTKARLRTTFQNKPTKGKSRRVIFKRCVRKSTVYLIYQLINLSLIF